VKTVSANNAAHLLLDSTTLTLLIKVVRTDGQVFGFTNNDVDVVSSSVTYEANTGHISQSAIDSSSKPNVDHTEWEGLLSASAITETALRNGVWDNADVRLRIINRAAPTDGVIKVARGRFGNIGVGRNSFTTEFRRMTQALTEKILEMYSPKCRADFCDSRCGLDIANYRYLVRVASTISDSVFITETVSATVSGLSVDDYFLDGTVLWQTGANASTTMEVISHVGSTQKISIFLPTNYTVEDGDEFYLARGCPKTLIACASTYVNIANMRAEPYLPGIDALETPSAPP